MSEPCGFTAGGSATRSSEAETSSTHRSHAIEAHFLLAFHIRAYRIAVRRAVRWSEQEFQRKLANPRIAAAGDAPETSRTKAYFGIVEIRMVQYVKKFSAELQTQTL